ncbi:hypothetical protein [Natronospora cellulosivora (SeqCode)]
MADKYKGKCFSCDNIFIMTSMTRHLLTCKGYKENLHHDQLAKDIYFMLRIQGKYAKAFFLYLDIKAESTLAELDQFLRDIWMQGSYHKSAFTVNGEEFLFPPKKLGDSNVKLVDLVNGSTRFEYKYDFSFTTSLNLDILHIRKGAYREHLIEIMSRNLAPEMSCEICDKQASWVSWDNHYPYYYCDDCIEIYESDYGSLPIINSPRVGFCGYTGSVAKNKDMHKWNG